MSKALDPQLLDKVVAGLDLRELDTLDRLRLTWRLWFDNFERWLRRTADDESSWLHRLADLLERARALDTTWNVMDFLLIAIPSALVLAALVGACWYVWKTRRARAAPSIERTRLQGLWREQPQQELSTLSPRDLPPALFRQACRYLAEHGQLSLDPSHTNSAIASTARVSSATQYALMALADAADRAIFGAWQPSTSELAALYQTSQTIQATAATKP